MGKRGLFGIFGTIFLVIIIALVGTIIYFYYFHVFQTVRICISKDGENTNISCQADNDCRGVTKLLIGNIDLNGAPVILSENVNKVINESIYSNETCFVRGTRGINSTAEKFEFLDSCMNNETEVAVKIRGKDAVQLFRWIRGK